MNPITLSMSLDQRSDIVKMSVTVQDAVDNWKKFIELKSKLLDKQDYQSISGKNFIKKSGWRKLAQVFNISDSIIEAKRTDREDKSYVWEFTVRATAPNGRSTIGIGSCDSKERNFAHSEHDVKSTAHTRAKSRAISDMIGGGEVSAEEVSEFSNPVSQAKKIN